MEQSFFFPEEMMAASFAVGHTISPDTGEPVVAQPWALPRAMNPAGGMLASVKDLMRFATFQLSDKTIQQMQSPLGPGGTVPSITAPFEAVGVNWLLYDQGGERIVAHAGGANGQLAVFFMVPSQQFALAMTTNAGAGLVLGFEVTDWVLMRMLGLPLPDYAAASLTPEQMAEYTGEYVTPDGAQTITVEEQEDRLSVRANLPGLGEISSPLLMVGDDLVTMQYMGLNIFADFVRDDTGKVAWIRFVGRLVART
jgi:CubicO group peptidase (beta-lactamase class C family)